MTRNFEPMGEAAERNPFMSGFRAEDDRLLDALRERDYLQVYRLLKQREAPLGCGAAAACLSEALFCKPKIFRQLLDACGPEEYVDEVQWRQESIFGYVNVRGTILTLAAAMNRTEHMKCLLERGYSVNADSVRAAAGISWSNSMRLGLNEDCRGRLTMGGAEHNTIWDRDIKDVYFTIQNCTPLAAAIACGSLAAVRLLLAQPGIQVAEDTSVCQAALEAIDRGDIQQKCVEACFGSDIESRSELLSMCLLTPETYVERCTPGEFREELKRGRLSPQQAQKLGKLLSSRWRRRELRMLKQLLRYYPEACDAPEVRNDILMGFLMSATDDKPREDWLQLWKALCGPVRDISHLERKYYLPRPFGGPGMTEQVLRRMAEGGELRADAESYWLGDIDTVREMYGVLKHVQFTRNTLRGISNLAMSILEKCSVPLLRKAEALGVLDSEPLDDLMAYAVEQDAGAAFRAAVLSLRCGQTARAVNGHPVRGRYWSARWSDRSAEEKTAWLRECWEKPLDQEACRERLEAALYDCGFTVVGLQCYGDQEGQYPSDDKLQFRGIRAAACCGENPELLKAVLAGGLLERRLYNLSWDACREALRGTPLCVAAAAGRLEQVKLLLDAGEAVNDENECRSRFFSTERDGWDFYGQIVTPLYMALRKGHVEVAEYLRARGGICYPDWEEALQGGAV